MKPLNLDLNAIDLAFLANLNNFKKAEDFYLTMAGLPAFVRGNAFTHQIAYQGIQHHLEKIGLLCKNAGEHSIISQYNQKIRALLPYSCVIQVTLKPRNLPSRFSHIFWDQKTRMAARMTLDKNKYVIEGLLPDELASGKNCHWSDLIRPAFSQGVTHAKC